MDDDDEMLERLHAMTPAEQSAWIAAHPGEIDLALGEWQVDEGEPGTVVISPEAVARARAADPDLDRALTDLERGDRSGYVRRGGRPIRHPETDDRAVAEPGNDWLETLTADELQALLDRLVPVPITPEQERELITELDRLAAEGRAGDDPECE